MYLYAIVMIACAILAPAVPLYTPTDPLTLVLLAVAPESQSCLNAPIASQCRTADQAASAIQASFLKYNITNNNEKAALISLIAYETGYENVYPGWPGQGTRNMQIIEFNVLYVESISSLAIELNRITGPSSGIDVAGLSVEQMDAVRELLTANDILDFGSAAWFLSTQCTAEVRIALQTGGLLGWTRYISQCVGTAVANRQILFDAAMLAMEN